MLTRTLTVRGDSLPDWYRNALSMPWQRCYTVNVDDLAEAASAKFSLSRRIIAVSATAPSATAERALDPSRELEFVHLNGTIQDIPDHVTFSTTQYSERLSRAEPLYLRFTADLLTSSVIFVGTRLDEPPLWQHLTLRLARGSRDSRELRHRSYLVTPTLDRARLALLSEFNVEHISMGAEEFVSSVLDPLRAAANSGFAFLSSSATQPDDRQLKEVAELATHPTQQNEFLLGNEPIWADVQSDRAILRECDATLWRQVSTARNREPLKGLIVITGTAGSGKSTSLMRLCLKLASDGVRVGWVDPQSNLAPHQIRSAMRTEGAPPVLAIDDADIYGAELAGWLRDILVSEAHPLILVAIRSGKVDKVLNPFILKDTPKSETVMPHLADKDIGLLIDLLHRENRLGILTAKPRVEQEAAFKEQAGRQLLVAMMQATSGKKFEDKAIQELVELDADAARIYALLAVASSFRFGLTRDEILIASSDFTNEALNTAQNLVNRHIVVEREGGFIWARHRRIAEIIRDELAKSGQLGPTVIGLARLAAAKVTSAMKRSDRPWRMLITFINHDFLLRTVGREKSRDLYGALEDILSWDFHFWLQRGSLEVEEGDLNLAEHFLSTARSLSPQDAYFQTEWAYLQFRKACENPASKDAPALVQGATELLESLMDSKIDPYPYHVLGSQGLSWARRGIPNQREKETYLQRLTKRLEEGCKKYPRQADLKQLQVDLRREYLGIAIPKP